MKGFSPFTKQIAKRDWDEEINPTEPAKNKRVKEGKKKEAYSAIEKPLVRSNEAPTFEGTDEYRNPADIPAQEYLDRGLNPGDYIPNYKKGVASGVVKAGVGTAPHVVTRYLKRKQTIKKKK